MASQGGKSKKGRQHVINVSKYARQEKRTKENKIRAWKKYIAENPKDEQNLKILKKLLG